MDDEQIKKLTQLKQVIGDSAFSHIVNQWILTMGALCQQVIQYQQVCQAKLMQDLEKLAQKQ